MQPIESKDLSEIVVNSKEENEQFKSYEPGETHLECINKDYGTLDTDLMMKKFPNLESLIIENTFMGEVPAELGKFESLKRFTFAKNEFAYSIEHIVEMTSLISLDLSSNDYIIDLPKNIGNLRKLEELYIQNNRIEHLPFELSYLTNLKILDASCNHLKQLPSEIGTLTNLKTLLLQSNRLKILPSSIGNLKSLQTINLDDNDLDYFPKTICKLSKSIKEISIKGNPIQGPDGDSESIGYHELFKEMDAYVHYWDSD